MNTNCSTHNNISIEYYQRYFNVDMLYKTGVNNYQKGINRTRLTVLISIRFSIVSPSIIRWLYQVNQHQALEHLNKLVREGLLKVVKTHRSPDGRVYVPTYSAAKFAQELMGIEIHFRSQANPALQFNHNNVMHNLINTFVILRGIHNFDTDGSLSALWNGFITEPEFRRLVISSHVRIVDGLIQEIDGTIAAIEIEHSFKNKASRQTILLKYLSSLQKGHYSKVFIFSQSRQIFDDIKRLHEQLYEELTSCFDKKTKRPILTLEEVKLLKSAIIYRTKFCNEISELFY